MSQTVRVDARGDACPIPIVKTKDAVRSLNGPGVVQTLVDNEIAVQNLTKMARQKGYGVCSEALGADGFQVTLTVGEDAVGSSGPEDPAQESCPVRPAGQRTVVVVVKSDRMGEGSEALGKTLLKGFLYALTQQDLPPRTLLFYNGGASLTCEGSPSLEDLQVLEAQGVEILTCGTCLDFYGLTGHLRVGEVTNMYAIAEKLTGAGLVVEP